VDAALRRDRVIVALSLAAVVGLAWLYLWRTAERMPGEMGGDMAMPMGGLDAATLGLTFVMWVVMMAGMMLPSAAPTVVLYAALVRKNAERGLVLPAAWIFAGGYLLAWAGFGLAAALLQAALERAGLLDSMTMAPTSRWLSAGLLVAAGAYQLTPLKDLCLGKCRDPVRFLMTHWQKGAAGALRMGARHGAYCVGCCWLLMLLLFTLGVMNLAWVALIAAFVLAEKLLPAGRFTSRFAGVALIVAGLAILAGPL
jgi:predicted metal-binding membrane protein